MKKAYNPVSNGQDTWRNIHEKRCVDCVWRFVTPWTTACQAPLSFTICLPEIAHTHAHWVGDAIQSSYPLWSPSLPALNLSQHRFLLQWVDSFFFSPIFFIVFCVRWPKYWSFSISPSKEYSGLISFRIDWLGQLSLAMARFLTYRNHEIIMCSFNVLSCGNLLYNNR